MGNFEACGSCLNPDVCFTIIKTNASPVQVALEKGQPSGAVEDGIAPTELDSSVDEAQDVLGAFDCAFTRDEVKDQILDLVTGNLMIDVEIEMGDYDGR